MANRKVTARWQIHESSQRALCRLAFVLLGIGPLLLAMLYSAAQFVPYYQEYRATAWSTWLSARLGVEVQVAAVESQAPERYVLHGLRLSHPESHASLGRVRAVQVQRQSGIWSVELVDPELETRQLAVTWQIIHDWFVCRPRVVAPAIRIACDDLQIRDSEQSQALEKLAIEIYTQADRTVVGAQFHMPEAPTGAKPTLLRIVRQHGDRHLSTILELDTGQNWVPCDLIAPVQPLVRKLGAAALFLGKLSLHQRNSAWQVNLQESWVVGIDTGKLTADIGNRITGSGRLWCESLKITERGLQHAEGGLIVEHGRIDERLLIASQQLLGVTLPRQVQLATVELHSFDKLCAMFEILPGYLKLAGAVESTYSPKLVPGTLIADAAGEIAIRSEYEKPIPLQNLVAALGYGQTVSTASNLEPVDSLTNGWFAQRAAWWLPLNAAQPLSCSEPQANADFE